MEKYKFITLFSIKNTPIQIHWSFTILLILIFLISLSNISVAIIAILFWGIMLIHELGHMWFASRLGLKTININLYILHGICYHQPADTDYENYLVAWGGVAAQAIIFIPCIIIFYLYGELMPWYINLPLIFLGYINGLIALFNLAPSKWLDGGTCWKAIPLYFKYKNKNDKKPKKKRHLKIVK